MIKFSTTSHLFEQKEIQKIPKGLSGIYAIFNINEAKGAIHPTWVKLGHGNLQDELEKMLTEQSVKSYHPTHFTFIENPHEPEKRLEGLISELRPLCK